MHATETEDRHLREMLNHRTAWNEKPVLRDAYAELYARMRNELSPVPGMTVELGSGIGAIKDFIPSVLTSDIFPNPWLDRVENAYALGLATRSAANLLLFDVFHHLEFPGSALQEFARVLKAGGRVIMVEPGFGWLGQLVYGWFHHEPVGFGRPISWTFPQGEAAGSPPRRYYAAQGNAWRIFIRGEFNTRLEGWRLRRVQPIAALNYVASGGFSKPPVIPARLRPLLRRVEAWADRLPSIFSTRLLVVLERMPC